MKAAAHRKQVVMNSAMAAASASDVIRSVTPVESLMSSIMPWNIGPPPPEKRVNELDGGPPAPPLQNQIGCPGLHGTPQRRQVTPIRKPRPIARPIAAIGRC